MKEKQKQTKKLLPFYLKVSKIVEKKKKYDSFIFFVILSFHKIIVTIKKAKIVKPTHAEIRSIDLGYFLKNFFISTKPIIGVLKHQTRIILISGILLLIIRITHEKRASQP